MTYKDLLKKISDYSKKYSVKVIGKSNFKRKIFAVEKIVDANKPTAIFLASIHGRENISTDLVCKMIDEGLFDNICEFNLSFILMANPDGVEISNFGLSSVPLLFRRYVWKILNLKNFELWKANGLGVDLNNNFDANFAKIKNSHCPSMSGYPGKNFESEPETKAIVNYTKIINPFFTISYHSKGEEIYFNYFQTGKILERDEIIAKRFASSTGYVIKNPENDSCGGFKDFCVSKLKISALTIEIGSDSLIHPIKNNHLDEIFERHKSIANDLIFAYNVFVNYREKYGI